MSKRHHYIIRDQHNAEVGRGVRTIDFVDAHRDEEGNIWMPPTAWAYMAACRAQKKYSDALRAIAEGDEPRPVGKRYRDDGTPSKYDECTHGRWMYEDCGNCTAEFAASFFASADTRPEGEDTTQIAAEFTSGAVPQGDAHD